MSTSILAAEVADQKLRIAAGEINRLFEALWRASRDLEAYNADFVSLLHDEARLGKTAVQEYQPVIEIWTVVLAIIEEVEAAREAHMVRKTACVGCTQKHWCRCTTVNPDFHEFRTRINKSFEAAETQYVVDYQEIPLEAAKVVAALNSKYRIDPLPQAPKY